MLEPTPETLAQALGRIPSGVFILTVEHAGRATGMLASWVMQAGFDPPMISVAIRHDRYVADWIASSGRFALNQVGAGNKSLLKHFGRGFGPDEPAFEGIALRDGLILKEASSYLAAEVAGSVDSGDHRVFLGRVIEGAKIDQDGEADGASSQERPALLICGMAPTQSRRDL